MLSKLVLCIDFAGIYVATENFEKKLNRKFYNRTNKHLFIKFTKKHYKTRYLLYNEMYKVCKIFAIKITVYSE